MAEKLQHKPYVDSLSGKELPMGPDDFGAFYSKYYQAEVDDSPDQSRQHLINRLMTGIEQVLAEQTDLTRKIRILDMGAGRQILEREMQKNPRFRALIPYVEIFTLDIARMSSSQLLAKNVMHVTADGSQLPFPAGAFDIVYSSMAIDFMPKDKTFAEVRRVLKENGKIFINFHHPDLIFLEQEKIPKLMQRLSLKLHAINQTKLHGRNSSKLEKRLAPLERDKAELESSIYFIQTFFGQIFPELIFHSTEEIEEFLIQQFPQAFLTVNEFTQLTGSNGWFTADIQMKVSDEEAEQEAA